ncbi:MAG: sulfotransferase [Magnetococcales bacterium]|nr:sulfotransferase [Magnetococcales bacterium]
MNRAERRRQQKLSKKNSGPRSIDKVTSAKAGEALQQAMHFHQIGRLDAAIQCYRKTLEIQHDNVVALSNMSIILFSLGKTDETVSCLQRAVSIQPDYAEAHNNLGNALFSQGKLEEASASYKKAITIQADYPQAYFGLGKIQGDQGKLDEAISSYKKAIALKPDYAKAIYNLGGLVKYSDRSEIEPMLALLTKETRTEEKCLLNFSIGKALSDLENYPEAFQYYLKANNLEREAIQFNISDEAKKFSRFQEVFNQDFFKAREEFGSSDVTPIFIVGMPRSGSTLIEQILSSHPDVFGAGELPFFEEVIRQTLPADLINTLPRKISKWQLNDSVRLGDEYISRIRKISSKHRFITDKLPFNFMYVGIIKLLLPNAKVIHSVRSAEDTCFSMFRQNFVGDYSYSYNMKELGQYYRLYSDMMAHWHNTLPGFIYDLQYETLTANQEQESRKLLDFCGLEWNEQCLAFHKTVRNVQTASNAQVRKPIYSSSVGGWRNYEKELKPLLDALGNPGHPPTPP